MRTRPMLFRADDGRPSGAALPCACSSPGSVGGGGLSWPRGWTGTGGLDRQPRVQFRPVVPGDQQSLRGRAQARRLRRIREAAPREPPRMRLVLGGLSIACRRREENAVAFLAEEGDRRCLSGCIALETSIPG